MTYRNQSSITLHLPEDREVKLKNFRIYIMEEGVKVYLTKNDMGDSAKLSSWTTEDMTAEVGYDTAEDPEDPPLVYQKGELVLYGITYPDYEADPSKESYFRYIHTPFNDGPHPSAAAIVDAKGEIVTGSGILLTEPIERFYVDGKYTVEHWQVDDTSRGTDVNGQPFINYDKASNVATMTFYINGAANAPWIETIRTNPAPVMTKKRIR